MKVDVNFASNSYVELIIIIYHSLFIEKGCQAIDLETGRLSEVSCQGVELFSICEKALTRKVGKLK